MNKHIFVGFGFGPIQSGLFVSEAFKGGNFSRIVISEIDQKLVDAVRANNGSYYVNVASSAGVESIKIDGVEIYNPSDTAERGKLLEAISRSTEICTSLPSVDFYDKGEYSVASLIARGLQNRIAKATIIYTAENNNHAAEILEEKVGSFKNVQFLNTVIGKMSQVVTDKAEIEQKGLRPIAPGIDRAFLVEEFNKILVSKCVIPEFTPGIEVFIEKEELLPFEEAKLYGHNAIHFLMALLGLSKGYKTMKDLRDDQEIMGIARAAFLKESGGALIKKYAELKDELFTEAGYRKYAEDLLERMTNPYLSDPIERAVRDPQRKLGLNDRIFGTMQLAMTYGIEPINMAKGAAIGIKYLAKTQGQSTELENLKEVLAGIWQESDSKYKSEIIRLTEGAILSS
ncbi:MAG: hypothetical protein JXD22_14700 [Sedimentisphaerales bacterium]|nr:hypothetical protein [Sedimentisphaerales bacterium]